MPTGVVLNWKNFWKFWNPMVCQQSENLSIAPKVVRKLNTNKTWWEEECQRMEFGFWQLCSAEWLLLGSRFCASVLSCGCSVYFFLNLISVFQWNLLIFAVFSVESHLETTTCCFPVEIPASSSLYLVSVCRQVWKVSCSTAVGQAERVLGQKYWFYRHWCTDQRSRGAVTLWLTR